MHTYIHTYIHAYIYVPGVGGVAGGGTEQRLAIAFAYVKLCCRGTLWHVYARTLLWRLVKESERKTERETEREKERDREREREREKKRGREKEREKGREREMEEIQT